MLRLGDLHSVKASTHYHITGSLTDAGDAHDVILHATEQASFRVKRCDARDVGESIDGRCDYTDYDSEKMNNLWLTLLTVPKVNDFTKGVLVDIDYSEILPCPVIPVMCLEREKQPDSCVVIFIAKCGVSISGAPQHFPKGESKCMKANIMTPSLKSRVMRTHQVAHCMTSILTRC